MTLAQLIFADLVPLRHRPRYFSIVLGPWAVGIMLGPVIGAIFAERVSWRWCFYINLPPCGLVLPTVVFFVRLKPMERRTMRDSIRLMDWTGCVMFTLGLAAFLVALTNAGTSYVWSAWQTIVPLVIGILVLTSTALYERFRATNPFLPPSLFSRSSLAAYGAALLSGLLLCMGLYYVTFYLLAASSIHRSTPG